MRAERRMLDTRLIIYPSYPLGQDASRDLRKFKLVGRPVALAIDPETVNGALKDHAAALYAKGYSNYRGPTAGAIVSIGLLVKCLSGLTDHTVDAHFDGRGIGREPVFPGYSADGTYRHWRPFDGNDAREGHAGSH